MSTRHTAQLPRKPGELDRGFGIDGTTSLEGTEVKALAILKAPGANQGKIIGVINTSSDFLLFRLEKDGTLDLTFGTNGYAQWGFGGTQTRSLPTGIAELSDNKILLTGHVQDGGIGGKFYPAAARFHPNGSADATFGQSGVFTFKELPPTVSQTPASAPQDTSAVGDLTVIQTKAGKILFSVNSSVLQPYRDWGLLIQLTSTGQLDNTFAEKGFTFFKFKGQNTSSIAMVIQTSGNIIVAGTTATQGFLAGFTETGKTNDAFGTGGFTELASDTHPVTLNKLLLQSDDKPVAIGRVPATGSSRKGYVIRTEPNGGTDNTFNRGLPLTVERPFVSLQLNSGDMDSGQSIIVAGELNTQGLSFVGRINEDGTLDLTFGKDGLSDTSEPGTPNYTTSAAVQMDNQIVIAGRKDSKPSVSRYQA